MTEIILTTVITFLLVYIFLKEKRHAEEMEKLVKALLAKDLREYTDNEALSKIKPTKNEAQQPEFIPIEEADDDLFHKLIDQQIKAKEKLT